MEDNTLYIDTRLGGTENFYLYKPKDWDMYIPDAIKKCVVFICTKDENGEIKPRATGFLVAMPSEDSNSIINIYLVTALHVAAAVFGKEFWVRVNKRDGQTQLLDGNPNANWIRHPNQIDNPTDVALTPFSVSHTYDVEYIPTSMFLTKKHLDDNIIGIGNEVFITGLFTRLSGKQKNSPIVRMGNIAMIPEDKIQTNEKLGEIEAYLIECRSIGGVSGSPVFFCEPFFKNGNIKPPAFYFGGLVHGHWDTLEQKIDNFLPEEDAKETKNVNMGIAIVVPATKILETLMHEDLVRLRKEAYEKIKQQNIPTLDI